MIQSKALKASRLKRLSAFMAVWCICMFTFMQLSVTAFAITSISFRSIAVYAAYVESNPNMLPGYSGDGGGGDKDIQLADTSTGNEISLSTDDENSLGKIWAAAANAHKCNIEAPVDNVKYPTAYSQMLVGSAIYDAYGGSQSAFKKDITKMLKKAGGTVNVDPANGDYSTADPAYSGRLSSAVAGLDSHLVEVATKDTYDRVFDTSDWNPNEGLAADALSVMYNVVNQIFYVVAQFIMWGFFTICALDLCYIIIEPARMILAPFSQRKELKGQGGMGSDNNGGFSIHSIFPLCFCSDAVIEATGGSGGNGGVGNAGGGRSNAVLVYAKRRAPLLIAVAVFLILTVLGYWRYVISWVAGWVIKFINFILNIGG